jgi:ParB family chromosome partitioning protein
MSDTKSAVIPTLTTPTILRDETPIDDKSSKALHAMYRVKIEQLKKEHEMREAGWIEEKIDLSMVLESAKKESATAISDELKKQREQLLAEKSSEMLQLEAEIKAQYEEKLKEQALIIDENIKLIEEIKQSNKAMIEELENENKKALESLENTNKKQKIQMADLEIKNKDLAFQLESLQSVNQLDLDQIDVTDKPYLTQLKQLSDKASFLELECAYQIELSAMLSNKKIG